MNSSVSCNRRSRARQTEVREGKVLLPVRMCQNRNHGNASKRRRRDTQRKENNTTSHSKQRRTCQQDNNVLSLSRVVTHAQQTVVRIKLCVSSSVLLHSKNISSLSVTLDPAIPFHQLLYTYHTNQYLASLVLHDAVCPLFVQNTVPTLTAPDNVSLPDLRISTAITAEIRHLRTTKTHSQRVRRP